MLHHLPGFFLVQGDKHYYLFQAWGAKRAIVKIVLVCPEMLSLLSLWKGCGNSIQAFIS